MLAGGGLQGVGVRLFDAHCHLQDARIGREGREETLAGYGDMGVERVVVNGTGPEDWGLVAELAERSGRVYPSFGLHPWRVNGVSSGWREELEVLLERFPEAGVGEIGLDRWVEGHDLEAQLGAFRWQLELGARLDRAVTIHCLKAWGALRAALEGARLPERGFLLHSYGGPAELVGPLAGLGAYFSFSGYFAWERKAAQRAVFERIPLERLLVETDAPDMAGPGSCRAWSLEGDGEGRLNHPLNIAAVYRYAAGLRGMEEGAFAAAVEENWRRLFGG